jgi:FkbM family methyltransferase
VLTKRHFEYMASKVDEQTRELAPVQTDAVRRLDTLQGDLVHRLDTLAYDNTSLLEAVRETVAALSEGVRRDDLETAIHGLETRLVKAIDERDRLAAERLEILRERLERPTAVTIGAEAPTHPLEGDDVEPALLAYLAPFLLDSHAFDVGAHRGRYAQVLLEQGLEVVAVEPNPELASPLEERLEPFAGAEVRAVALDATPGRARLHVVEGSGNGGGSDPTLFSTLLERDRAGALAFRPGPEIETTTVDRLRDELGWPAEVGLLKIDVEGAEDRVLRGLGATRPEVLMVEYWGAEHMLALPGRDARVVPLPDELRASGMRRWITLIHEADRVEFSVNDSDVPPASWGNVLFFTRHEAFFAATRWCHAHLPERFSKGTRI